MPSKPELRPATWLDTARYYAAVPLVWLWQFVHNLHGIIRVLDITRFRPLPHGLVTPDHPWVTGVNPLTGRDVWCDNVVYRSRRPPAENLPADADIVRQVCSFLAGMVELSAGPEIPWGPRRRMPHAINYIHGSSHYNSGILVFTDFADAMAHFSDGRFRAEVRRFVRVEKRELLILFRRRDYDPEELAAFSCGLRSMFGWFCNANGPKRRVLWGNPAPFPACNMITGCWIADIYRLKRGEDVSRPPVAPGVYFQQPQYRGWRSAPLWPERLLAGYTAWRVRSRGEKAGLFFVDRRKLVYGRRGRPSADPTLE